MGDLMKFNKFAKALFLPLFVFAAGCEPGERVDTPPALLAGAASASLLPTVDGSTDYIAALAPVTEPVDPLSLGIYIEAFDQGKVDIDNGKSDAAWVHDDIRGSAIALQAGENRIILLPPTSISSPLKTAKR